MHSLCKHTTIMFEQIKYVDVFQYSRSWMCSESISIFVMLIKHPLFLIAVCISVLLAEPTPMNGWLKTVYTVVEEIHCNLHEWTPEFILHDINVGSCSINYWFNIKYFYYFTNAYLHTDTRTHTTTHVLRTRYMVCCLKHICRLVFSYLFIKL